MTQTQQEKSYDLFSFFDLEESRQLPCSSLAVFLDYLFSPGAKKVTMDGASVATGSANFRIAGPRCDDGGELYVRYRLTREEVKDALDHDRRIDLTQRLGELGMKGNTLEFARAALNLPYVR